MTRNNPFAVLIFILILGLGAGVAYALYRPSAYVASIWMGVSAFVMAYIISAAIKVADQWLFRVKASWNGPSNRR